MGKIRCGYGSEWHLLRYMGRHRDLLDAKVLRLLGADAIHWLDFPFGKSSGPHDNEWMGLDFLTEKSILSKWMLFWPQRGNMQNWDAIAQVKFGARPEWLLVEAKSNFREVLTRCKAKVGGGRLKIVEAMQKVKRALGVSDEADWLNGYYQFCNRVAVLYFLRQAGIHARLLFIYFTGDSFPGHRVKCPKTEAQWIPILEAQKIHIGLPYNNTLEGRIHQLFLPMRET